jgi:hypothetical protein
VAWRESPPFGARIRNDLQNLATSTRLQNTAKWKFPYHLNKQPLGLQRLLMHVPFVVRWDFRLDNAHVHKMRDFIRAAGDDVFLSLSPGCRNRAFSLLFQVSTTRLVGAGHRYPDCMGILAYVRPAECDRAEKKAARARRSCCCAETTSKWVTRSIPRRQRIEHIFDE